MLREHLLTDTQLANPMDWQMQICRQRIRNWEKSQKFRDLVYQHAVVEADLNTPAILRGVAAKAKRGRVDAARLVLEVTGRHNPRGEQAPTQIALVVNGVPRPLMVEQAVEAEASEVSEED
jgi:Na+-translocating ferredoxin:NAD+ oxidoreductase RnfC subunit